MNRNRLEILRRAAPVLLAAAFSGCTLGPKTAAPEVSERIEAALQRSDHEGLIAYYQAEAAAARDKVSWHRRLAASYAGPSSAGGGADPRMAAHCNSLADMYGQVAAEYDGMAQFHQLLAREPALRKP
jgi:hypothetical protein